jgi:hypothetical protein
MTTPESQNVDRTEYVGRLCVNSAIHFLAIGVATWWWAFDWIPEYFRFHENKGYLNPDLLFLTSWFVEPQIGPTFNTFVIIGLLVLDTIVLGLLLRLRYLNWLVDFWNAAVIGLPLAFVLITGTKMLDCYWGLQGRIAAQQRRVVGERGREMDSFIGTWRLTAIETLGKRVPVNGEETVLVLDSSEYTWRNQGKECSGSWSIFSSSDRSELNFLPAEINENAWGGYGYYRVTPQRLALHLTDKFPATEFDSRGGGQIWFFEKP